MAWLRIDDRVRTHPKIVQAGPQAAWLWFCGVCYCREHLTDGFIAAAMLPTLVPGLAAVKKHASVLVSVGLWHERTGGYEVHDFLDWNPSKAEVEEVRAAERDKKRKQRGYVPEGLPEMSPDVDREGLPEDSPRAHTRAGDAGLGSGLASAVVAVREESARETRSSLPMRRGAHGGALMPGSYATHAKHGACNDRGLCVPKFLHEEFVAKVNGDAAYVARFYADALAALPVDAVPGEDAIAFWRNAWKRKHGTTERSGLVDKMRASDAAAAAVLDARGPR